MPRLKDRSVLPPGGLRYYCPQTNWFPTPHASFEDTVAQIIAHRKANPHLAQRHSWATDRDSVALELDNHNTKICLEMNWRQYVAHDNPPEGPTAIHPGGFTDKQISGSLSAVKRLAAGAALLMDWEESGLPPVDRELAQKRAVTCVTCPLNSKDELSSWFTFPVASAIKSRLSRLHALNLTTLYDEKLNVCSACLCPLRLKIWTPVELIAKRLKPEVMAGLHPQCWIPPELAAASPGLPPTM
jgi:hypothetical protein